MYRNLKLVAAAAALAATGAAHAVLERFDDANSSLVFVAYDRLTTAGAAQGSFLADLNFNLNDFLPGSANALTQQIQWNFNTNTISINGVVATGALALNNWSSEYSQFLASSNLADMRWGVIGGDNINNRFVTTGNASAANLATSGGSSQTAALIANMGGTTNTVFVEAQTDGTHSQPGAGANFAAASDTNFIPVVGKFGTNGNWNNTLRWNAVQANNVVSRFYYLEEQGRTIFTYGVPDTAAPDLAPAGTFSTFVFDQNTNTLTWQSPIPEPGTYAMLLAGLAAVGFVARRRRV